MMKTRDGLTIIGSLGAVVGLAVGLGFGVGHFLHKSRQPAAPAVVAQTPAPAPAPALPPAPSQASITGDDANGPAEVAPMTLTPPSPEAQPELNNAPNGNIGGEGIGDVKASSDSKAKSRPAWRRFAVSPPPIRNRPMIAVVIDDLGLDHKRAEKVIAMRAPLTLAFMTYAEDLPHLTAEAHAHGHELMVHMPMQPLSSSFNAGPQALTVGATDDELRRRIDWGLSRFTGYVGVNNHMGSRFTEDQAGMAVVMQELSERGLLFLDSVTTPHSVAAQAAAQRHVPCAARQVFLDNEQSQNSIRQQLERTEVAARKHGYAIAIGHPHDATIAALTQWLDTVESRGFVLVPVTTIVLKSREKG